MTTSSLKDGCYTTGDLARMTGNTLRTVRYYEAMGLLRPAERSGGGHRMFSEEDVARLKAVTDMRAVGISLEDVARILRVRDGGADTLGQLGEIARILDEQLATVRDRLGTLRRVERDLEGARKIVDACSGCVHGEQTRPCGKCETYQHSRPNPWLDTILAPQTDGER